jgi:hypothetical protein
MMLYKLLTLPHNDVSNFLVISLMGRGRIADRIEALGVKVKMLDLEQGQRPSWKTIKKLRLFIRAFNPDIVQGWMYHGNIAATIAVFLSDPMHRNVKLLWNIRQTLYSVNSEKVQTRFLIKLGCWLSFLPDSIIYKSNERSCYTFACDRPCSRQSI